MRFLARVSGRSLSRICPRIKIFIDSTTRRHLNFMKSHRPRSFLIWQAKDPLRFLSAAFSLRAIRLFRRRRRFRRILPYYVRLFLFEIVREREQESSRLRFASRTRVAMSLPRRPDRFRTRKRLTALWVNNRRHNSGNDV